MLKRSFSSGGAVRVAFCGKEQRGFPSSVHGKVTVELLVQGKGQCRAFGR